MSLLRPLAALLLVGLCLFTVLACGTASTPKPTPPAAVAPLPTPLPDYAELHAIAQGLLDDLVRAFDTNDGALLAATLSEDVAEVCSPEELQLWAEWGEDIFGGIETAAVFLDLANYNRAWLGLRADGTGEDELLNFPLPMERGMSGWRLKLTYAATTGAAECPFVPRQTAMDESGGPTPLPPALPTPLPDYAELHAIAQGLLDDLVRAFNTNDGALLAATLSREITDLCSADELQGWAEEGGDDVGDEVVEAVEVFVNLTDYRRTLLEIHTPESDLAGAINIPMPMELEGDGWRVKVPLFGVLPGVCPFIPRGMMLDDEYELPPGASINPSDVPDIAGLPGFSRDLFAPPEGMAGYHSGSSAGTTGSELHSFTVKAVLIGGRTAEEIVKHYRAQWAGPDWETLGEQASGGAAWFIWKAPDASGQLWYGALLSFEIDGWRHSVSLTLQNSAAAAGPWAASP